MSASEIMCFQGSATFDLFALRFWFVPRDAIHFPPGQAGNLFRGQFGKILMRTSPSAYARFFAPVARATEGPSGLHDPPRPFVFRVNHLNGVTFPPGERFHIGVNVFDTRETVVSEFGEALATLGHQCLGSELVAVDGWELLRLPLFPHAGISFVRVRFLSPTELKNVEHPEFSVLFARIRDRASTLRALYGAGPLEIDFKAMGERASRVRMTRCELDQVRAERVSGRTGQRHPLGGFIGIAEYEGDVGEFIPYLEIARWTGVGRQTVWGKGEIACEAF
jgi:hypothetical protein